jgi:DNA-binding winged helix-turn-helix (wHTH) protein
MNTPQRELFEFSSFLLDAQSRVLFRDGEVVRLTPKALDALLVLVRNSGLVVEKEQLLNEVWAEAFVEEGSLPRAIHELRRVLGDDSFQPRFIETIPKRGYRFVAQVQCRNFDRSRDAMVIERHVVARVTTQSYRQSGGRSHSRVVAGWNSDRVFQQSFSVVQCRFFSQIPVPRSF